MSTTGKPEAPTAVPGAEDDIESRPTPVPMVLDDRPTPIPAARLPAARPAASVDAGWLDAADLQPVESAASSSPGTPTLPRVIEADADDEELDDRTPTLPPVGTDDPYLNTIVADRYRVLGKLGEGGMGVVYLAEHVIIEKKVALKILSQDFARKADLVQLFMQEAKAASKIGHENIVDITDFGETPSGSVFFAMEFLDGGDLAAHIHRGGPMPYARVRPIVTQICRALGAAHAKGIIHRDMKPENVFLVEREGRRDFVKVLDFGIAKISAVDDGQARLTRTGMIFGTPEYMSPEQARGDRPDHRVDIYAVGCILFEMLTGDVPYHADSFMGVLTKHMFDEVPRPSQRAPQMSVPPDVEAVVMKAMAKNRDQRFQTMKEMSLALAACGGLDIADAWGNEPSQVSAREITNPGVEARDTVASLPTVVRRRRTMALVAVAAMAVAGSAVVAVSHGHKPANHDVQVVTVQPTPEPVVVAPPPVEAAPPAPAAPTEFAVKVESKPAQADVLVNDRQLGRTPWNQAFPTSDGPFKIVLRKNGYRDFAIQVNPRDGNQTFSAPLEPAKIHRSTAHASETRSANTPAGPPGKDAKLKDLKDPFKQ